MEKSKKKVFKKFVNERWSEQLPDFESKLERALDNAMDEAFDYAWDYQQKRITELKEALMMAQNLCYEIVDSSPETIIKGNIESMAFELGHHPCILNANNIESE